MTDLHFRAATARNALVIIAVVVTGGALYWLAGILTPLALAMFLMVMIDSFARLLVHRVPLIPKAAALPTAIVLSVLLFAFVVFIVAGNAGGFANRLLAYSPKLDSAVAKLAYMAGVRGHPTLGQLLGQLNPGTYLGVVADQLKGLAINAVLVLIYLGFLLASRHGFERKAVRLFPNAHARHEAAQVFLRIRNGIEGYLWVQAVCCGIIALASWAVMSLLGLENALFWAFLIFVVGFIPIIGGAVGILAPPLLALVQFGDPFRAVVMVGALQTINFVVGNVVYPRMQGKSLNIDPVVVLLSLAFWGAIWGLPGMFLSTPLTVTAMVILAQFDSSRWVAVLLSSNGDPLGHAHDSVHAAGVGAPASGHKTKPI